MESFIILDRVIRFDSSFEAGLRIIRGHFLECSHFAIAAKLHCPKGDRINESLLYSVLYCATVM